MIFDKSLQFSADQALTGTSLVASTDYLDLGQDRDIGPGQPLWLVVVAKSAFGGTTPTMQIKIQTDDNSSFSSATDSYTHPTLAAAAFGAGAMVVIPFPYENERHVRVAYTMGGTSPTSTVDAFLTPYPPQNWKAYPDAI